MKRFHLHVGVANLEASIAFYTGLFGEAPAVTRPDYAKWMLDDPRINFAISQKCGAGKGIEHLGIEVEGEVELAEVYGRLKAVDAPVLEEGATTCCYAQSQKSWIADPDCVVWEAVLTTGHATNYGASADLAKLAAANAAPGSCCAPAISPTTTSNCC